MKTVQHKRRDFLKKGVAGAIALSPLAAMLGALERLEANAIDGDYKAIVCVLLEGGADACNMIAPLTNDAYARYRAVRKNIALPQESLLKITPEYGMRENMGAMRDLFSQNRLAIVANVGTLIEPVTPQEVEAGSKLVPFELFAHNTQRDQWMLGDATGGSRNGWAARVADQLYAAGDSAGSYAKINVADVNSLIFSGGRAEALHFADASVSPDTMRYYGFGPESGGSDLGNVYQDIYEAKQNDAHKLMAQFAKKRVWELNLPNQLGDLFQNGTVSALDTGVHEVGKPLGSQLELVANIIKNRSNFPGAVKRQIFFVNHHGWDTHDSDNEHQVGYLSDSLGAFQKILEEELQVHESVTTFTVSDFGRSLSPNGAGTDHGWGSHAFVMGGAVKGGKIYGTMPKIEVNSPDAWHDRLVPTTAMESYLETIMRWFGVDDHALDEIFPNRHRFQRGNIDFL